MPSSRSATPAPAYTGAMTATAPRTGRTMTVAIPRNPIVPNKQDTYGAYHRGMGEYDPSPEEQSTAKNIAILAVLLLILALLFGLTAWPTPYSIGYATDPVTGATFAINTNRFTGKTEVLVDGKWRPVRLNKMKRAHGILEIEGDVHVSP